MRISELQKDIHATAIEKGWWGDPPDTSARNFGELLMLVVTEVAEAMEHYRNGAWLNEVFYDNNEKPDGVPIELADIIIRVLDLATAYDINVERALQIKMAFNETRPHRHGGKLA